MKPTEAIEEEDEETVNGDFQLMEQDDDQKEAEAEEVSTCHATQQQCTFRRLKPSLPLVVLGFRRRNRPRAATKKAERIVFSVSTTSSTPVELDQRNSRSTN